MNWTTLSFGPDGEPCEPEFTHRDSPTRPPLTIRVRDGRVDCGSGGSVYYGQLVVRGIHLLVKRYESEARTALFVLAWAMDRPEPFDDAVAKRFAAIQYTGFEIVPPIATYGHWLSSSITPDRPEFAREHATWVEWVSKIKKRVEA